MGYIFNLVSKFSNWTCAGTLGTVAYASYRRDAAQPRTT